MLIKKRNKLRRNHKKQHQNNRDIQLLSKDIQNRLLLFRRAQLHDYISKLSFKENSSNVWRGVKALSKKQTDKYTEHTHPIINSKGIKVDDVNKRPNLFIKAYSSQSKMKILKKERNLIRKVRAQNNKPCTKCLPICKPFTYHELRNQIQILKKKCPGKGGISNKMLKLLDDKSIQILLEALNSIWKAKDFPSTWKESIIIPIHKKGKPPELVDSYRPISLNSHIGKLYEKLIHTRLSKKLEAIGAMSPIQNGFRKNCRSEDGLAALTTEIQTCFQKKEHLGAVYIDFKSAFDRVNSNLLISKLSK